MAKWMILLGLLLASCAHKTTYPEHWWKPVPKEQLKWWEISPDQAKRGEVVLSKRNELGILSNFAHTPFSFRGKSYQSVEGLWQSMKFPEGKNDPRARARGVSWTLKREEVEQMIGHKAKKAGGQGSKNMKKMGINWVTFEGKKMTYRTSEKGEHYKTIRAAMEEKLKQNPKVKEVLLSTGNLVLKPDHKTRPTDPPAWKYFDIWMELRDSLKR